MSEQTPGPSGEPSARAPEGDAYDWLHRGLSLLQGGHAAAATTLLERAHLAEPQSAAVLEALSRARFDSGQMVLAEQGFRRLTDLAPDSDYAHFGLGSALARLGRFGEAEQHLALAVVMKPEQDSYAAQLRQVRATLAARRGTSAVDGSAESSGGAPGRHRDTELGADSDSDTNSDIDPDPAGGRP